MTMLEARHSAVVVRPARAEDLLALGLAQERDLRRTLVAVRDGEIVGGVVVAGVAGASDTAAVSGLFVRPAHRGQGLARILVRGACANIVARGCRWAIATVARDDEPVRRILSTCGWRPDSADVSEAEPIVYRRQVRTRAFLL